MSEKQTEARRLADEVDEVAKIYPDMAEVSAELRRLDAENEALRDVLRCIANVGEPWQRDYLIREIQAAAEAAITKAEPTK